MKKEVLGGIIIGLIIVVGVASITYFQNFKNQKVINEYIQNSSSQTSAISSSTVFDNGFYRAIREEFQKAAKKYNGEVLETDELNLLWISNDDLNIINDDSLGIKLNTFNCNPNLNLAEIFKKMTQSIGFGIDEIMTQNGFEINQKNSSKSIEDNRFYDYIKAYEKGLVKSAFIADPNYGTDSSPTPPHFNFSFGVINNFDDNYQQQAPYLKDLRINEVVVRVKERIGDFVLLGAGDIGGGGYLIVAKLINGKWTELSSGQDYPDCEFIKKYEIPKEISSDCY